MALYNSIKQTLSSLKGDLTKKLITGSVFTMSSTIVNNLTKLALITFLTRQFSKDEFGIWVTITSATAVAASGDFGIGNTLRNVLSLYDSRNDKLTEKKYFFSVFYFLVGLCVLVSLLLLLMQSHIPFESLFKTDNSALKLAGKTSLLWTLILIILNIPFGTGMVCFFAYQEAKYYSIFTALQSLASFVIVIILTLTQFSIVPIAVNFFTATLVISIAGNIFFVSKRKWEWSNSLDFFNFHLVGELILPSLKFFVLQVSNTFLFNSGTLLISSQIGINEATVFNLVQKLYFFCIAIFQSIFNPIWSGYSAAINRGDWKWNKKIFKLSLVVTFFIFTGIMVFFLLFGNTFLRVLAGRTYDSESTLFFLMGVWALFYMLCSCASVLQYSMGKINLAISITLASSLFVMFFASRIANDFGVYGITLSLCTIFLIFTITMIFQGGSIINKNLNQ